MVKIVGGGPEHPLAEEGERIDREAEAAAVEEILSVQQGARGAIRHSGCDCFDDVPRVDDQASSQASTDTKKLPGFPELRDDDQGNGNLVNCGWVINP